MPDIINIKTAQNVNIKYRLATVGDRLLGYIIDIIVIIAYGMILGLLSAKLSISTYIIVPLMIPIAFFSFLFEKFNEGQSPGKKVMNIRVVSMDGNPLTTGTLLLRWLFRMVDIYLVSGIVAILAIALGEKGQRIGDMVANSTVIKLVNENELRDTAYKKVRPNYSVVYTNANVLDVKDIGIIKEVLRNYSDDRFALIKTVAERIESILQVTKESSSEVFLKTIITDYNFLANYGDEEE